MAWARFWSRRRCRGCGFGRNGRRSGWRSPPLPSEGRHRGWWIEAQLDEAAVVHDQIVFNSLVAGVGQVVDLSAGEGSHLLGYFTHLMAFGHLVEDLHSLPCSGGFSSAS